MVNGEPKEGGLADLRMGSSERFVVCTTDGMDREEGCPGYFGHIELATPLFHIGFNRTVLKVLRCVGYHSSKLLLDPSNVKDAAVLGMLSKTVMGPARLDRAMKACMSKKLDFNSGAMQPKYKLEPKGRINVIAEFPAPKANDMEEATDIKMERTQVSLPWYAWALCEEPRQVTLGAQMLDPSGSQHVPECGNQHAPDATTAPVSDCPTQVHSCADALRQAGIRDT